MLIIYILLILLAAFPMLLTIWRMRNAAYIKKNGVLTDATVAKITTLRTRRGIVDFITLQYTDKATGQLYDGKATISHQKVKEGDLMPLMYLPNKPSKYAIDTKKGYTILLVFSILIFLFIVFAVYKIQEMVATGQL